jgi:Carboxypeptidase regulatory-like domain
VSFSSSSAALALLVTGVAAGASTGRGTGPNWPPVFLRVGGWLRGEVVRDPPGQRRGLILGRVVDGTTGRPVAGAVVYLGGIPAPESPALSDAQGRFVFLSLPAGDYSVYVTKPGYADGGFGRRWTSAGRPAIREGAIDPSFQRVSLAEGQRRDDVVVDLWRLAAITGRVVDEHGQPVVGARVEAWPRVFVSGRAWFDSVMPSAGRTDDRGVYRIDSVPAAEYVVVLPVLSVTTPTSWQPSERAPNRSLALARVQLLDASDEPYESVATAGRRTISAGPWQSWMIAEPMPAREGTDRHTGYGTTFYPGSAALSGAGVIRVAAGDERAGVDFQLMPIALHSVSGVVRDVDGPATNVTLELTPASGDAASEDVPSAVAVTDSRGTFSFLDVPAGTYRLDVLEIPNNGGGGSRVGPNTGVAGTGLVRLANSVWADAHTRWASQSVVVAGADVEGVNVPLDHGARITGEVRFIGAAPPPAGRQLEEILDLDRPDGRPVPVSVEHEVAVSPDGAFRSIELPPGRYFVRADRPPSGWSLQSAMYQGRDLSMIAGVLGAESISGVVVTFTDSPSHLTGTVLTPAGSVDPDASVAVFPVDRATWTDYGAHPRRFVTARVSREGRYDIVGLPAGDYWAVAVDDAATRTWQSPTLFDELARLAERVSLTDGQRRALDLLTREVR